MPRRPPPLPPTAEFDDDEREAVLAANRAFYRAFNDRDVAAMDALWAPTGPVVCLHPGHPPLFERPEIMESWRAILGHPNSPKVRCSDEWATGRPGLAMVVCRDGWKMIGHHSAQVPDATPNRRTEPAPAPVRDRRKLH